MSTRAMRKLRGDTLDDDLRKIHDNEDDPSKEEDDEAEDGTAIGGRGGGARPKQRINPFEMVSECAAFPLPKKWAGGIPEFRKSGSSRVRNWLPEQPLDSEVLRNLHLFKNYRNLKGKEYRLQHLKGKELNI